MKPKHWIVAPFPLKALGCTWEFPGGLVFALLVLGLLNALGWGLIGLYSAGAFVVGGF